MPIAFSKLRISAIALAAFVGASLMTADAFASCTSMPDAAGCQAVCCCKASESATPIRIASPATVGQDVPLENGNVCPDLPGCHCRPQTPTAPQPEERRADESRPDPGRDRAAGSLEIADVSRPTISPAPPTISPPRKAPLYLRNSRLLI
jgi:hypothetical protein